MSKPGKITPMFRQYRSIKADHPDAVLLFRMGDFYEMFYEDATDASRVCELTLTARGKGTDHVVPMCGFPHHQLDQYSSRLLRAGRRVAVCDQVEDPRTAKGLVRREVVRVLTPGTVIDPGQLDALEHCWAAAVTDVGGRLGAAFLDASTGDFLAWETGRDATPWPSLAERLGSFGPKEIVHPDDLSWPEPFRRDASVDAVLTPADRYPFTSEAATTLLKRHFGVTTLDGFGLRNRPAATAAAGGLLLYLQETQKSGLQHIDGLVYHEPSDSMVLDAATRCNLEIDRTLRDARRRGSLLDCIDSTKTAPGARLLRDWLLAPHIDPEVIRRRHDAVDEFVRSLELRDQVRDHLEGIHDIERLVSRAVAGSSNPRELLALRGSLERLPALEQTLSDSRTELIRKTTHELDPCTDVAERIALGISDDPPVAVRDGGTIRDGFDPELDELRAIRRDGRSYIASLETREREVTSIGSLKVRFNKVFGYFIEVSRANLHLVPDSYIRKQTIANGERFITPELKDYETRVLHAQERIESLEYELFGRLRTEVAASASRLKAAARAVAIVDVLSALAETAVSRDYCRPTIHEDPILRIEGGRHPVVERALIDRRFVPNDTEMDCAGDAITILTGPNMGGKSTYLRQVALIVLMAQAGSFVPADSADVGIADRVFCRVGASDNLAEGQSTFMVEMSETANILHHATRRSLVLLDEIGRGTSTFDGLSIAWAVVEFLHARPGGPCRTLFATHYHELTELAVQVKGVVNHRMAVRERGDGIVFTHRVEPGPADRSYGIHVARLAGIPPGVVERAGEILRNLEHDAYGRDGLPRLARSPGHKSSDPTPQRSLFPIMVARVSSTEPPDPAIAEVLAEMRASDPDHLTPMQALQLVHGWRRRLKP